jgi:hypothetical protein
MIRIRFVALILVAATTALPACGSSMPAPGPTPTPVPPVTETFTGTIACCFNADAHNFTVTQSGNDIDLVLTQVLIGGTASTIHMSLGIGQPAADGSCAIISGGAATGPAGAAGTGATLGTAEIIGTLNATGTFCVQVTDVGNIPANTTINYTVTVTHT